MVESGDVPVQALIHYERPRRRDGDTQAKFGALGEYWLATLGARHSNLSGKAKLVH
jgi:hypothetical protein